MWTARIGSGWLQRAFAGAGVDGIPRLGQKAVERAEKWCERRIERHFDARYGVETSGIDDDLPGHGAQGVHLAHAEGYEPIQPRAFRAIVRAARIDPGRYVFVDFGSGKGRALILAAEYGFPHAIGIEFAPGLHNIAERNIGRVGRRRAMQCRFELRCGDAAEFELPDKEAFLFFYNPFGEAVMRRV